jgi:hypothetical protein
VKPLAAALTVLVLGVAFAHPAPAGARAELWELQPNPQATLTPIVNIASPPPSVAADAAATCANDEFFSYRAIPAPTEREVTLCGLVVSPGSGGFMLDVDGQPIQIIGSVSVKPGDAVVVRGRYHRDKSGADWVDRVSQTLARDWPRPGYVIVNGTTYQ